MHSPPYFIENLQNLHTNMGDTGDDNEVKAAKIVSIAYGVCQDSLKHVQSKRISGADSENVSSTVNNVKEKTNFECVNRFMNIPIVIGVKSNVIGAYDSLKKSHSDIESMFNATEQQISNFAKILSPMTGTVSELLDNEPLKMVDSAICASLDYVEEKIPQLKVQTTEIYENFGKYVRVGADSAVQYSDSIINSVKNSENNTDTTEKLKKE